MFFPVAWFLTKMVDEQREETQRILSYRNGKKHLVASRVHSYAVTEG